SDFIPGECVAETAPKSRITHSVFSLHQAAFGLEIVTQGTPGQDGVLTNAVEIQINRRINEPCHGLHTIIKPVTHISRHRSPGTIPGAHSADEDNVGPAKARFRITQRTADKSQTGCRAVTDCRFSNRQDDRKKPVLLVEKGTAVEPSVVVF